MAEQLVLDTKTREKSGRRATISLRKQGMLPAIVYGHKETPEQISISKEDFAGILKVHAKALALQINGKKQEVLIQEIQYDYLGKEVLHVDFLRASATDIIRVVIPIELRGTAAGLKGGGVLIQPLHSIHVECTVANRPDSIRVKLDDLQLGQAIHIRELAIPEGVKCLDNPEAVVVQIKTPTAEVVAAPSIEGAVEPEVITAKKKEKEEGEE